MPHRRTSLLAFASIALIVLSGCSRHTATGVFVDPAFGPLIAPDTKLMAGIRLDKLRETSLYKKLDAKFDLNRRLNLFSERTGLDPRKDIWQVLLISNGHRSLVMARGRFTVGEMEPKLGELGNSRSQYKDYTIIGNPQTSVVFMNPGVAVAGAQNDLKDLLDHRAEYSNIPDSLGDKLKNLPAADQLWLVTEGALPESLLGGPDTTGMKSMLSNFVEYIQSAQFGMHVDEGAELKGSVECVSAEGAQRVHDALKGLIGLARLRTPDNQMQLLKVYDSMQVNQRQNKVDIEAAVAANLVDPLLQMVTPGKRP